ncbi:hypothetical protein FYL75_25260, partial [Salmonella enterica subsp. enterica serovar Typhimurium]
MNLEHFLPENRFPLFGKCSRASGPFGCAISPWLCGDFASDNTAGAAPEALNALLAYNGGAASGYGTDHVTAKAT